MSIILLLTLGIEYYEGFLKEEVGMAVSLELYIPGPGEQRP